MGFGGGVERKQQPLRGVGWGLRTDHPKTGAMQAKKRLKNRSVFVTHPTPELDCPPLSKRLSPLPTQLPRGLESPAPRFRGNFRKGLIVSFFYLPPLYVR